MDNKVRLRFAPSPTGPLHIGGVRTALYNYLFAKQHGGDFLLRIEDTDQNRFVEGAEHYITDTLNWLGITPNEGVSAGGDLGPYRQSERKDIYKQYVDKLLADGNAYYAFDSTEELEAMRERLKNAKVANPVYDSITRMSMKNSLTLPKEEVEAKLANGAPYVVRLKVPRKEEVRLNDLVRDWVVVNSANIDDKILLKSDGMPTYHLANVVDDHLMGITHVIRGEEWLPSAPLHVLLYRFLGWEKTMPRFAHLPLLLKPDGNGKLSKRDADKHGYPVFPLEWKTENGEVSRGFREDGYLPEAIINFLSLLGWNPGSEKELYTMDELIQDFSIQGIGKAGSKFDIEKAKWFNQQYIKQYSDAELAEFLSKELNKNGIECDQAKKEAICDLLKERVTFTHEFYSKGEYFFHQPQEYDAKVVKKRWNEEVKNVFIGYSDALKKDPNILADGAKASLNKVLEENNVNIGKVMQILRVAITGLAGGPDLMGVIEVLGGVEVSNRIDIAIQKFH